MHRLEEHALRTIGRLVDCGCGVLLDDLAARLGLSGQGAGVVVGRLDRAGYLRTVTVADAESAALLIVGLTAAGALALRISRSRASDIKRSAA